MTNRVRVIPTLLLRGDNLVKTVRFSQPNYIGDPVNTVKIFNELEVDELAIFDIGVSKNRTKPNFRLLEALASECFMPLSYGGGIASVADVGRILNIGFEKVVINSSHFENLDLISEASEKFGSQAIVASIDYKKNLFGRACVYSCSGTQKHSQSPLELAREFERRGAGEILLNSIDREGTWAGYDIETLKTISTAVTVPVIASGGAGSLNHLVEAISIGRASALALGSMVVYQKKDCGVLINFLSQSDLKQLREVP